MVREDDSEIKETSDMVSGGMEKIKEAHRAELWLWGGWCQPGRTLGMAFLWYFL